MRWIGRRHSTWTEGFSVALVLALGGALVGCEPTVVPSKDEEPDNHEPSPNAQILPAPLSGSQVRSNKDAVVATPAPAPAPALVVVPLPTDRALREETALAATNATAPLTGAEFDFEWALPDVQRPSHDGPLARALTNFHVELALPGADRIARLRVRLDGALFVLPEETELRGRSDRYGWMALWPDGRSYRTVPRGALATLFEERRVDVMPPFDVEVGVAEAGMHGDKSVVRRRLKSPLGTLELAMMDVPELGEATLSFCDVLLEFLRVRRTPETCVAGELPLTARYKWAGGGEWTGTLERLKKRADLNPTQFQLPPAMPIFKPGELPPDEARPWTTAERAALFPSTKEGHVVFRNTLDVPVLLSFDGVPVTRLDAGQETSVPVARSVKYHARDFLGQAVLVGGVVGAPATVFLGATPEIQPPPSSAVAAPAP